MSKHLSLGITPNRRLLLSGMVVLLLAGLCFAAAASRRAKAESNFLQAGRKDPIESIAWQKVMSFSFDKPEEIAACKVVDGTWEVRDGRLWAASGDKNRTILLGHVSGQAVRVEFDAIATADDLGRIGDITLILNAQEGTKSATTKGYALTTGSYYNTCTTFYREGQKLARTELSPLESAKASKVVIEFDRGHIRYWINDKIVLEAWDYQPLALDSQQWLALRTYATLLSVDNLTISTAK